MLGARSHVEVNLLRLGVDESHDEFLHGPGVVCGGGGPVGRVDGELPPLVAIRAVELQHPRQQGGDKLKHGVAHAVQGCGGQLIVVIHVIAVPLGLELEGLGEDLAQDGGQELVVGDVLDLRPHHLPGLLVQGLLVPVGVDGLQKRGEPVVLPHQDCVDAGQARVVIDPLVPGPQTLVLGLELTVGVVFVLGQEVTAINLATNKETEIISLGNKS